MTFRSIILSPIYIPHVDYASKSEAKRPITFYIGHALLKYIQSDMLQTWRQAFHYFIQWITNNYSSLNKYVMSCHRLKYINLIIIRLLLPETCHIFIAQMPCNRSKRRSAFATVSYEQKSKIGTLNKKVNMHKIHGKAIQRAIEIAYYEQ